MHGNTSDVDPVGGSALPPDGQILYTTKEAAHVLSLSERQVWVLVTGGLVQSVKIGRLRRIPRTALVAYVENLKAAA